MYITDKKEEAVISIKKTSNMGFHTGNSGNVNLLFFHCKLYNDLFFFNSIQYFTVKLHE